MEVLRGATSLILPVRIVDSNGIPKTGLTNATTGLSAAYIRELDTVVTDISLISTTKGVYSSGGFVEIDATKFPGDYELSVPNAAIGTGDASRWCVVQIVGTLSANLYAQPLRIDLVAINMQDSVRGGMTALPNANAQAAGGLFTRGTGAGQINQATNGQIDVNAVAINSVATTSVTTVNANLGTTQPVNFTGTAASALVKSDMIDIASAAVSTSAAQIGVNLVNIKGTASAATAGYVGPDWNAINAPTTLVDLSGTTIKNVDNAIANVTTVTNLTNAPTNGDFTATMKTSLNASTPASITGAVGSVTGNVGGNVVGSVGSVAGNVSGNVAGSVGSVTGNVGGNVTGSVGSVLGNIGGNVLGSVANVLAFASAALAQMFTSNTGETYADSVPGSVVYEIAQNASTDITPVLNRLPAALVGGKMDSSVNNFQTAALAEFFTINTGETYADAVDGSVVKEIASNVTASTDTSSFSGPAATQIDEIQAEVESLRSSELVAITPTMTGGDIQVTRGMDYYAVDGFAYSFVLPESGADLTGATGKLYIQTSGTPLEISSYSLNATTRVVTFQLTAAQSAKALGGTCEIDVILANTHVWKVAVGTMTVTSGLAT